MPKDAWAKVANRAVAYSRGLAQVGELAGFNKGYIAESSWLNGYSAALRDVRAGKVEV